MHAALLQAVVRAPLSFFNKTPPGRVLNRRAALQIAAYLPQHNSSPCTISLSLQSPQTDCADMEHSPREMLLLATQTILA